MRHAVLLLFFSTCVAWGQSEGGRLFTEKCSACHGLEARGTSRGAGLVGNRRLRGRSIPQISELIRTGIPTAGMPAFDLPETERNALAGFVHALNSPAAEVAVPGDRLAGERFFFARGQCSSCHMVKGRGNAAGPDLSNIALEMTVDEIRESLLRPDARISPGYDLVQVVLRDGGTIRGFARNRSNFDVQLQDLAGHIRPIQQREISAIREENILARIPTTWTAVSITTRLCFPDQVRSTRGGPIRSLARFERSPMTRSPTTKA